MFQHGKAKEKKVDPTPEAKKLIEEKLAAIEKINKDILKKRNLENAEEKYNLKNLDYLFKASKMITDSTTIWNYRKEIIMYMRPTLEESKFYQFLSEEVKRITQLLSMSPKSYVLWHHREWILQLAAEYELKNNLYSTSLIKQDLVMINLYLMKDNRNFHCWNYRLNLVLMIKNLFPAEFDKLLKQEINFTIDKIKESCSNFSAWHYRSKLVAILFARTQVSWNTDAAIEYFEDIDFKFLVKAVYTDPRDQSPWNYHRWLINSLTPVLAINQEKIEDKYLRISFSENLRISDIFDLDILSLDQRVIGISNTITIDLEKLYSGISEVYLKNRKDLDNNLLSVIDFLEKDKVDSGSVSCYVKHNLEMPLIKVDRSHRQVVVINQFSDKQTALIVREIKFIEKLIEDSEGFLEFALFRKVQLNQAMLHLTEIKDYDKTKDKIRDEIMTDLGLLIEKSKRQSKMYESIRKNLSSN